MKAVAVLFLLSIAACGKPQAGLTTDNKVTAVVCAPNLQVLSAQYGGAKGESYPGGDRAGSIGYRFESGPVYWMQASTDGASWSCNVKEST